MNTLPPAGLLTEGGPFARVPATTLPARAGDGEIHVIELKHASPASVCGIVERFFEVTVTVDEGTGALVVRCGKPTLEEVKKLVEKLDKPSKRGGGV